MWLVRNLPDPDLSVGDKNGFNPAMQAANNGFVGLSEKLARLAEKRKTNGVITEEDFVGWTTEPLVKETDAEITNF
jgi:hypothetical protein